MGNCFRRSSQNAEDVGMSDRSVRSGLQARGQSMQLRQPPPQPLAAKNCPLRRERISWSSEQPLTEGQLQLKRDEFWDTAPAFEGRKEIWDALKAAAGALESGDHALAQAIVSGAGVTLPHGLLTDCYDELGCRYQLPLYVLAAPLNLVCSGSALATAAVATAADEGATEDGDNGSASASYATDIAAHQQQQQVLLNLRLSDGRDLQLPVGPDDQVQRAKRLLERSAGCPAADQRWFCYGNLLPDRARIRDCTIPRGFIVQVIVRQSSAPPPVTD